MTPQPCITRRWLLDPDEPDPFELAEAAALICAGELIAIPTETVYGLAADALQPAAVAKIFVAKERPQDNPLIVHLADASWAADPARGLAAVWDDRARKLAAACWPGPLTLVVPAGPRVPGIVTAGLPTVGLRVPAHPVARALIEAVGSPLAAPSANRSGRPSPTLAAHVIEDLDGRIAGVIDAGPCTVGLESTVLDLACPGSPRVLRPGAYTHDQLGAVLGEVVRSAVGRGTTAPGTDEPPRAPGMKYTHYAPRAPLHLAEGDLPAQIAALRRILAVAAQAHGAALPIGLLMSREGAAMLRRELARAVPAIALEGVELIELGPRGDAAALARRLFVALREFDARGVGVIHAESYPPHGPHAAIMNRLRKAATS